MGKDFTPKDIVDDLLVVFLSMFECNSKECFKDICEYKILQRLAKFFILENYNLTPFLMLIGNICLESNQGVNLILE